MDQAGGDDKAEDGSSYPAIAPARKLLATICAEADGGAEFVFPGRLGAHDRGYLKKHWPKICKVARLAGVRVHDIRHTYACCWRVPASRFPSSGRCLGIPSRRRHIVTLTCLTIPLRRATERVGAILAGKQQAKVVRLRK